MKLLKIRPVNGREEYFLGFGIVWGFIAGSIATAWLIAAILAVAWWLVR